MADGLHCHVVMSLTIPSVSTVVSIELRAGGAAPHASGSVMLNVSREKSPYRFKMDPNDHLPRQASDNDDLSRH
eukprot:COSAG06_NODE_3136_length_5804_cov_2.662752_3_plen_74_part_00